MRGANWWENLIGECILAFIVMTAVFLVGLLRGDNVPLWGYFLAAYLGILRWKMVTFKELDRP